MTDETTNKLIAHILNRLDAAEHLIGLLTEESDALHDVLTSLTDALVLVNGNVNRLAEMVRS